MAEDERDPGQPGRKTGLPEGGWPRWILWGLLAVVIGSVLWVSNFSEEGDQLRYDQFLASVDAGKVRSVTMEGGTGRITGVYDNKSEDPFTTQGNTDSFSDLEQRLDDKKIDYRYVQHQPGILESILPFLLPMLLIFAVFAWMQRRATGQMSGIMSIGRSRAKTYTTERPGTTFADVAGYEGVKREIKEVVDFLKEPGRFSAIGARIPKGVLLVGPPGTGKTLIARAVAGEAGVPFLSVTGSDFMEMFVGVGASRVRDLFDSARKLGRAIIFIDEIDSIGRKRGAGLGGGHDEREQTLNQMLSEMDGFEGSEGIVMMAATNRPDILDPALLRPGRFDRQVVVPLPEFEDRRQILEVHIRQKRVAPDVDLDIVSRGSPGMSGADLANLVNEAALTAVRDGATSIHMRHFEDARDRILMGQRRESLVLSDEEKEMTAYHEAGHAICAMVLPHADPVHKVTILPRGMALGVTQTLPSEERHSYSEDFLRERIIVSMGGRVAEDLIFGRRTTGASDDLQRSTDLARGMVTEYGMSDRIGPRAWGSSGPVFLGEDLMHQKDYSEETSRIIDEETSRILHEAEGRCRELLTEERNALDLVARALLEHETIDGAEIQRLIDLGRANRSSTSDPDGTRSTPAPGTPAPGTPAPGTPALDTPSSGTSSPEMASPVPEAVSGDAGPPA